MKTGLLHLVRGLWLPRPRAAVLGPGPAWPRDAGLRGTPARPDRGVDFADTQPLVFERARAVAGPGPAGWHEAPAP